MEEGYDLICIDLQTAKGLRKLAPTIHDAEPLTNIAQELSDPQRFRILSILNHVEGALCVGDLSSVLQLSVKLCSHHLKKLKACDLATSYKDGRLVMYSITPHGKVAFLALKQMAKKAEEDESQLTLEQ